MRYNTHTTNGRAMLLASPTRHERINFMLPESTTKTCTGCAQSLPLSCFSPVARGLYGVRSLCKTCSAEYRRSRYLEVRDREIVTATLYQQAHRQQARAWAKESRLRTIETRREYNRRNRDNVRKWNRRYQASKRGATVSEPVNYDAIYRRDRGICHICLNPVPKSRLHFDHVIPLSKGGPHTEANIKVSHARCNLKKGAKI